MESQVSEKEKNIIELIQVSTLQPEQVDLMIPAMVQAAIASSQAEVDANQAAASIKESLFSHEFLKQFTPAFDEQFSGEEISELVSFYKSDVMRKFFKNYTQTCSQIFPKMNLLVEDTVAKMNTNPKPKIIDSIISLSKDNYKSEIDQSDQPILVDVYSTFCGPCRVLAPIFSELSNEYKGSIKFGKINADTDPSICQELSVHAMPTLLFIQNGKVLDRHVGLIDKDSLDKKIKDVFGDSSKN